MAQQIGVGMQLRRIRYKNIYGYLSGDLTFRRGENFLVGINGCGKTTVLNLIRWLLQPSMPDLLTLEHDLITLDLEHNQNIYSIQSRMLTGKQKGKHELKVVNKGKPREFKPIRTSLHANPKTLRDQISLNDLRSMYKRLSPEPHEIATWSFLFKELPSPVFVGLERNVQKQGVTRISFTNKQGQRTTESLSPIATATELMRDAFNTSRSRLVEINDELNRKVLELSFSGVLRPNVSLGKSKAKDVPQKIAHLKSRFEKSSDQGAYSKALSAPDVRTAVVKYLEELEELLTVSDKKEKIWVALNQHNFDRASKMFDLFEAHEINAKSVQTEIEAFSAAVNRFLMDSGKEIHFKENTGVPYFEYKAFNENLSLSELSSGEAQIVILLSYFAFLAKTGIPIIIDEPELSLHVEWQKHFVEAVKQVMPNECQTIMATHSPEICGASNVNVQAISIRSQK
jgi:ABC-type lipoprotein export system ATPase subunit